MQDFHLLKSGETQANWDKPVTVGAGVIAAEEGDQHEAELSSWFEPRGPSKVRLGTGSIGPPALTPHQLSAAPRSIHSTHIRGSYARGPWVPAGISPCGFKEAPGRK